MMVTPSNKAVSVSMALLGITRSYTVMENTELAMANKFTSSAATATCTYTPLDCSKGPQNQWPRLPIKAPASSVGSGWAASGVARLGTSARLWPCTWGSRSASCRRPGRSIWWASRALTCWASTRSSTVSTEPSLSQSRQGTGPKSAWDTLWWLTSRPRLSAASTKVSIVQAVPRCGIRLSSAASEMGRSSQFKMARRPALSGSVAARAGSVGMAACVTA